MSTGLNMQTDRQTRYNNREYKQKIQQQNVDRSKRLHKRRCSIINKVGEDVTNEIVEDVKNEISTITLKKQQSDHRYPTRISTQKPFIL